MLVVSYNPGYQNILKALKPSTKQRFVAIEFDFLPKEQEVAIVAAESGLDERHVAPLVNLAHRLRAMKGHDLEDGGSTRLLAHCKSPLESRPTIQHADTAAPLTPPHDTP